MFEFLFSIFFLLNISDLLKNAPNERVLLNLLADISNLWRQIGLALALSGSFLDSLEHSRHSDIIKLSIVIDSWLTSTQPSLVTWETVITAIKGPVVNHVKKADELYQLLTKGNFI